MYPNPSIFQICFRITSYNVCYTKLLRENDDLKSFYTISENETDFYLGRNLIDNILFKSYLFFTDTQMDLREEAIELMNNHDQGYQLEMLLNATQDFHIHKSHTRLLGLKGNEWAAKIIGEEHPLSKDFLNIVITSYSIHYTKLYDNLS